MREERTMELLEGLMEYVDWEPYRKALGLPEKRTETYEPLAQNTIEITGSSTRSPKSSWC